MNNMTTFTKSVLAFFVAAGMALALAGCTTEPPTAKVVPVKTKACKCSKCVCPKCVCN